MARALWTGSISFGLVNIPIHLYAATDSHQLEFHQFDSKSGKRVRYRRVVEGTDDEVPYQQIIDGYEVEKGKFVTLSDEEMASAAPKQSRTLDLEEFVPLEAIDPIAWNHTYFVGPAGEGASKAFAVLRDSMKQMDRVGVGRFVMRSKQYLATLRPYAGGLVLETMFFADEIRDLAEVPGATSHASVSAREVDMAKQLIDSLSSRWRHDKYKDTHRDGLLALIKQKAKGQVIDVGAPESEGSGKIVDLMDALKRSLGRGESARPSPPATRGQKRKPATRGRAAVSRRHPRQASAAAGAARRKR